MKTSSMFASHSVGGWRNSGAVRIVAVLALILAGSPLGAQSGTAKGTAGHASSTFSVPLGNPPPAKPSYAMILLPIFPTAVANNGMVFDGQFRWHHGELQALLPPNGLNAGCLPLHMNGRGEVVGLGFRFNGFSAESTDAFAVYWAEDESEGIPLAFDAIELPMPSGRGRADRFASGADFISDAGMSLGSLYVGQVDDVPYLDGCRWDSPVSKAQRLGSGFPGGEYEPLFATAANSAGTMIGSVADGSGYFIGDTLIDYFDFEPRAINDQGLVIGVDAFDYKGVDGVLWNGARHDLPGFFAYAINNAGDLLGMTGAGPAFIPAAEMSHLVEGTLADFTPFLLAGAVPEGWDLNDHAPYLISEPQGDFLADTYGLQDINDDGMIAGFAKRGDGQAAAGYHGFLLVPASLAVDANRDGRIILSSVDGSDRIGATAPFRFWINDDDDSGDVKSGMTDDVPSPEGSGGRNADDGRVNGIRDLVDFFPICLDLGQLLTVLPPGTNGISYFLKQEDAALGFVYTGYGREQAFDYLRGPPAQLDSGFGPSLMQKAGEATVSRITAAGVDLLANSPAFQARIEDGGDGVILVEACRPTAKPLVLEVRKGAEVVASLELPLRIDPVEKMIRYHNLRALAYGTAIDPDNQGPNYGVGRPGDAPGDPFQDVGGRRNVVFVHGYNVNSQEARGSAAEMFKRLYWGGSKAKYYAVLWRGDDGQGEGIAPAGVTPDYHRNVGHAWQQGPWFRELLTSLVGDTALVAHSLGNLVTQVALTHERDPANLARLRPAARPAGVRSYFAVNAAVPLEALTDSDLTAESKAWMRHPDWDGFDERLWPTEWHALFDGMPDGRGRLTWRNVFAGLDVGMNLYSLGEEVLANPINDSVPLWAPLFDGGLRAWVSQEKHKGGAGLAAALFRSWTGGWVANDAWYLPIVPPPPSGDPQTRRRFPSEAQDMPAPEGVPTYSLPQEPFFQRFQAAESGGFYPGYEGWKLHAPLCDPGADNEARKLVTFAKCLGEAIPALSFAQGSNASTAFTRPGMSGNLNLNTAMFRNGWPQSRPDPNWKHSDCLNVAYTIIFPLYDKITDDGGLK